MAPADAEFARSLLAHWIMFGTAGIVRPLGNNFTVEWGGRGFPTVFATKDEAIARARLWVQTIRQQEAA